jgi:hypothetical protein
LFSARLGAVLNKMIPGWQDGAAGGREPTLSVVIQLTYPDSPPPRRRPAVVESAAETTWDTGSAVPAL